MTEVRVPSGAPAAKGWTALKAESKTYRAAGRARRRSAAALLATLWLSGCMSSAGDGSLLGFSAAGLNPATPTSGNAPALGSAPELNVAAAGSPVVSAAATAEVAAIAGETVAAGTADPPLPVETAARTPSMASFAAPGEPNRPAGRSLYESLFTESEARTPVRNAEAGRSARVVVTRTDGASQPQRDAALPGVDPSSIFEIGQRASVDDEDFLDDIGSTQVASLSGMARLAPSGFLIQRDDIVTNCFDSRLVQLLHRIEQRFGERVVVTSGFRSPSHNRRVNGAKASMHMTCKAADLHVPGVAGQTVAAFVRSLPDRGGVGTYCHTAAIHVDVGRKRDWNWACRRRSTG